MSSPKISVIFVNWNTRDYADAAISSLRRHEKTVNLEIIVVDNDSSDGSADFLESRHENILVIRNSTNAGFAKGNNLGVANASGDFVLLLNTDTLFSEEVLPACLAVARRSEPAIVGCRLLNKDGSLQVSADSFPSLSNQARELFESSAIADRRRRRLFDTSGNDIKVDWLCGAFLLMERTIYNRLGGLSEEIFMYGEDTEFCWRANKIDISCRYVPSVSIIHFGGGGVDHSSRRALVISDAGRLRSFALMRGKGSAAALRLILILRSLTRGFGWGAWSLLNQDRIMRRKAGNHLAEVAILAGFADAKNFI